MWALALAFSLNAAAAPGPWTLGQNDLEVTAGGAYGRWQTFYTGGASAEAYRQEEAVTRSDLVLDVTYGLLPQAEFEVRGSWAQSAMSRTDDRCTDDRIGAFRCETTKGLAPVTARLKVRLLDELGASPVTWSIGPDLRFGDHTRPWADRMTNIGLGQTDYGLFTQVGRSGGLGGGAYGVYGEAIFRRRTALTYDDTRRLKYPGDEVEGRFELIYYPSSPVAFGLRVQGVHMLTGLDWGDIPDKASTQDLFVSLQTSQASAGAQVIVRSLENVRFILSVDRAFVARNTASDNLVVGAMVSRVIPSREGSGT